MDVKAVADLAWRYEQYEAVSRLDYGEQLLAFGLSPKKVGTRRCIKTTRKCSGQSVFAPVAGDAHPAGRRSIMATCALAST